MGCMYMYPKVDDIIEIISTGKTYRVRGMNGAQDEYELMELTATGVTNTTGATFYYCLNPFPVSFSLNWFMRNRFGWFLKDEEGNLKTAQSIALEEVNKCECGAEAVGSMRHSTWCKKHDGGGRGFGEGSPLIAV